MRFRRAAEIFGPQKGASPEQVEILTARLDSLAKRYRRDYDLDVDAVPGSGAAGGLAGGLAALGGRIRPGFDLVATMTKLADRNGRRPIYIACVAIFAIGSIFAISARPFAPRVNSLREA